MNIAIAGSDAALADVCAFAARRRGHEVLCVDNPTRLFGALPFQPATTIIGVRDIDEEIVATVQRLGSTFPEMTIFVTAERYRSELPVMAAGAANVVRIPYHATALIAQAELLAERSGNAATNSLSIKIEDLEIDLGRYAAWKNGQAMTMTKLELRLLYCLCEHYPNLASTERLLSFGWEGSLEADPALIKTHISHIRGKMRNAGGVPLAIRSRQTLGYELVGPQ